MFETKEKCDFCNGTGKVRAIDGSKLRKHRESNGLSLRKFASNLGFSTAYLSDVERNRRGCTDKILEAYEKL